MGNIPYKAPPRNTLRLLASKAGSLKLNRQKRRQIAYFVNQMTPSRAIPLILLGVFLSACDMVTDKQATDEFKLAHPNASIDSQFVGEGDSDHAYMHFQYTDKGSTNRLEQVWLYQRQPGGLWKAIHKDDPEPVIISATRSKVESR